MSNSYSVRIRGREHGPFSLTKMRELIRKGQVGRMHEVSNDGVTWVAASSVTELFDKGEVSEATGAQRPTATQSPAVPAVPERTNSGEWFHSNGGGAEGPYSITDLERLASQGVLNPTDHIWDPGRSEWVEASSVASLRHPGSGRGPSSGYAGDRSEESHALAQSAWALKSTATWKLFIALWCLVIGFLVMIGGLVLLSRSGGIEAVIASAISSLGAGIYLMIIGGFLLHAYSAVTAAVARPEDEAIAAALQAENRAWVAVAVALLLSTLASILFAIVFNNPSL